MTLELTDTALVLLSGGQDSTTCLYWALKRCEKVYAIIFDYGQRHKVEVQMAIAVAINAGVLHHIIKIPFLKDLAPSALLNDADSINGDHKLKTRLPASFIPNRNQLFLTIAHAFAQGRNIKHIVIGAGQEDYSGYPDCRDDFIKGLQTISNLGSSSNIIIHTPLMFLNKRQTFDLAETLDCLEIVRDHTITCYEGNETKNEWGMGCGKCNSCILRRRGYQDFIMDV